MKLEVQGQANSESEFKYSFRNSAKIEIVNKGPSNETRGGSLMKKPEVRNVQ